MDRSKVAMRGVDTIRKVLDRSLPWVCVVLFAAMILMILLQITARVTGISLPWTETGSRVFFIWHGLVGAAYVIGTREDVVIDLLANKLPDHIGQWFGIFAHVVAIGFAVWIMIWGGMRVALGGWDSTYQLLPISQGQAFLVLPLSGLLIALYSVLNLATDLRAIIVGRTGAADNGGGHHG